MRLKIILLTLSLLLFGFSGCSDPNAFRCVLILVDDNGNKKPTDEWYWFCLNKKTKEEKTIWLKDSDKCIRSNQECKWIGLDLNEEAAIREHYKKECNK